VKLAADLPAAERMTIEVLRSDGAVFKALTQSRRNSPGPWTKNTAGRIELCNVQIPTRLSVKK
jgi:peptidylprolyl isomerase